jgi:hypothetical protein
VTGVQTCALPIYQAELERQFIEEKTIREEERITAEQERFSQELENKKQIELQAAELTGANKQSIIDKYKSIEATTEATTAAKIANVRLKQAKLEVELDKKVNKAKTDLALGALNNIAQIAGKNSKIGKAAAIAATTIETFKGAQSAFSSLSGIPIVGPILGALAAAAAIAGGVANVRSIVNTKSGLPGEGGVSAPAISNNISASPVSSDGGAIASSQSNAIQSSAEATQAAISASLQENPNVLVVEDVENVRGRQTAVTNNASF